MKKFYGNIGNRQIVLFALDEDMAKAYLDRDKEITELAARDKSKKLVVYSDDNGLADVEQFIGIKEMKRAKSFMDEHIGLEYEIDDDTITVYGLSPREYRMFLAFIDSRKLW